MGQIHFLAAVYRSFSIFSFYYFTVFIQAFHYSYFCSCFNIQVNVVLIHFFLYTKVLCQVHCCHVDGWVYHRPW